MKWERSLREELLRTGVRIRLKSESRLMVVLGALLRLVGNREFITRYWTTVGPRTIWAPIGTDISRPVLYEIVVRHELVHIQQARRWPVFWQLSYLLLPVPVLFAWFRWRWEREAYLVQLYSGVSTPEEIAHVLWHGYAWTWPPALMRRYFKKKLVAYNAKQPKPEVRDVGVGQG